MKFKHAPLGIPLLTEEQWQALEKSNMQPLTKEQKLALKRAREIYKQSFESHEKVKQP